MDSTLSLEQPTAEPKSHIHLTSCALKGEPLNFTPHLTLSARSIRNPPTALRKLYDGRCEGLKSHFRQESNFESLLHEAQSQIYDAEAKLQQVAAGYGQGKQTLEVAVSCVRGRHRSVAFVEELASLDNWPSHYEIVVVHRDVDSPHKYQDVHRRNFKRERRDEKLDVTEEVHEKEQESVESGESESVCEESADERNVGDVENKRSRRLREVKIQGLDRMDSEGEVAVGDLPPRPTVTEVMTL